MKKIAKHTIAAILGWQVRRLRAKNTFTTVAIAGSIGKTSTKFAVATVLGQHYRVQYQEGNYNDLVSVPLVYFGQTMPSLFNPLAWLRVFIANERTLARPYPYDVVVVELGTDHPGDIAQFGAYIAADIGVLTAIAPEHMEYFGTLDAVAQEETAIAGFSKQLLYNKDLCGEGYIEQVAAPKSSYAVREKADYLIKPDDTAVKVRKREQVLVRAQYAWTAEAQLYSAVAAAAAGDMLGMTSEDIKNGIAAIRAVNGRMQQLKGVNNTTILDDTYNSSPDAAKAALAALYRLDAPQKIAILGNMNELGEYSEQAHREVGEYCDPRQLAWVVTIGKDANAILAPAAEAKGCKVKTFDSPYKAGEFVRSVLEPGALVLAKGSQNGVFAEESVKLLLADPADTDKLVRQSDEWLKKKREQFPA